MYQPVYYQQPRQRKTGLWIALIVVLMLIGCLCTGGVALLLFLPSSPVRLPDGWVGVATPTPVFMPVLPAPPTVAKPLPLPATPTPTVIASSPVPDTPTPGIQVALSIPDLSNVVSAAFDFTRRSGTLHIEGTGQFIWPDRWSVYEVGQEMYLADKDELFIWSIEQDGWVQVLPSARLHDNLAYWLDLLSFAKATKTEVEDDGTIFSFFDVEVPFEQNTFGVRDLHGSGWFRWDPVSGTLDELAYDLVYLDRLGTSNNDLLYMQFHSWGEPVVVPER